MRRFPMQWTPEARAIFERATGGKISPEEEAQGFLIEDDAYQLLRDKARRHHISMSDVINITVLENPLKIRAFARQMRRKRARKRGRP